MDVSSHLFFDLQNLITLNTFTVAFTFPWNTSSSFVCVCEIFSFFSILLFLSVASLFLSWCKLVFFGICACVKEWNVWLYRIEICTFRFYMHIHIDKTRWRRRYTTFLLFNFWSERMKKNNIKSTLCVVYSECVWERKRNWAHE